MSREKCGLRKGILVLSHSTPRKGHNIMSITFLIIALSVLLVIMGVVTTFAIMGVEKEKKQLQKLCGTIEVTHTNAADPIVYVRAQSKEEMRALLKFGRIREHCVNECVDRPVCRTISLDLRKVLYTLGRSSS